MHATPTRLSKVFYLASLATVVVSTSAFADTKIIGFVKTVTPDAFVVTGTSATAAAPGTPVHVGDVLRTGKAGSMGVTFHDDTIVSIGPKTDLTVDEYLYAPGQDALQLVANLSRGSLNYVSGVIAKLRPESVLIKTPTGTIGVRGTHFVARVED